MDITHEQAHHLIQSQLDSALSKQDTAVLTAHLNHCLDCQAYADELSDVERVLVPVMKRHWTAQPAPLSIPALIGKKSKLQASTILTMRSTAISFIAVLLFFGVWQFVFTNSSASGQMPPMVPPMPTPFTQTAQFASATNTLENCETTVYTVQQNDTLAGIAAHFSVAEDEILALNNLQASALRPSMELIIPICTSTPTGTVHPATFTTTYTPILEITTSAPGEY